MRIAVVGTGYVGLVTGTCFAETGNNVCCIDIDKDKVTRMIAGEVPIFENGLEELFHRNQEQGRLTFTDNLEAGIEGAEIIFLALPTPPGADGSADLKYILGVADQLGGLLKKYTVVVDKSTVPVGTAEKVHSAISKNARVDFDVVSNPEFLREGLAIEDFMRPDRIVIGADDARAVEVLRRLYAPFQRNHDRLMQMSVRSAELTKYAANAMLATRISFMNEMANLCEKTGANVDWVRIGMGGDSRIGKRFLFPGIGYGGSCFPKDVKALAFTAQEMEYDFQLVNTVMRVNDRQKLVLGNKVKNYFGNDLSGYTFAIWGLAFKPETDDIRDAPSIELINELLEAGAQIRVFDPEAMDNVKQIMGDKIYYATDQYDTITGASALIVVTEWSEFRNPDFERIGNVLIHPAIFDGRNLYALEKMQELSFYYESIGRKVIHPKVHDTLAVRKGGEIRERGVMD